MLKSEIVTRLIKEGHITIEEAIVLMEKETIYLPQTQPFNPVTPLQPYNPYNPYNPYWYTTGDINVQTTNETGQSLTITSTYTKN